MRVGTERSSADSSPVRPPQDGPSGMLVASRGIGMLAAEDFRSGNRGRHFRPSRAWNPTTLNTQKACGPIMKDANGLRQEVIQEMETLPEDQVRDVLRFIESLRRTPRSPDEKANSAQEETPAVSVEEVRERLSTIKGSMAETISDMREDRV